jgi:hypothetical protein
MIRHILWLPNCSLIRRSFRGVSGQIRSPAMLVVQSDLGIGCLVTVAIEA